MPVPPSSGPHVQCLITGDPVIEAMGPTGDRTPLNTAGNSPAAIFVAALLIFITPASAPAQPRTFKWKLQGQADGTAESAWASAQRTFGERVRAATSGRIDITYVSDVCRDNQVLDAVRDGRLNLGFMGVHYRPDMALMNLQSLPIVPDDRLPEILAALKPKFDAIWRERWGVKLLAFNYYLPQLLYTARPADTLEGLRPQRIRQFNRDLIDLYARAGCTPVMIASVHEVQTSLSAGALDGAQGALPAYVNWGWARRLKYISSWPLGSIYMALVVDIHDWHSLTPDLQEKLIGAAEELERAQWNSRQAYVDSLLQQARSTYGSQVMNPSRSEIDALLMRAAPVLDGWKQRVGPDSQMVLDAINAVLGTRYQ
jgi:TRAP-type C4-dicarboxylate transport system substrate-binding protein